MVSVGECGVGRVGVGVVTGQLTEMAEAIICNLWQQQKRFK